MAPKKQVQAGLGSAVRETEKSGDRPEPGSAVGPVGNAAAKRQLHKQPTVDPTTYVDLKNKSIAKTLKADDIKTFQGLCDLAKDLIETISAVPDKHVVPTRVFTVVSGCTGSLQEHVIFKALEAACPQIKFKLLWSCEKDKAKQRWIKDLQAKILPPPASGIGIKTQLPASGVGIEKQPSASGVCTEKQRRTHRNPNHASSMTFVNCIRDTRSVSSIGKSVLSREVISRSCADRAKTYLARTLISRK